MPTTLSWVNPTAPPAPVPAPGLAGSSVQTLKPTAFLRCPSAVPRTCFHSQFVPLYLCVCKNTQQEFKGTVSTLNYVHRSPQQNSKTFSACMTETLHPLSSNFSFPPPRQVPGNQHFTFCFCELHSLDTACKWTHAVSVLLQRLMSLSTMSSRLTHVVAHGRVSFLCKTKFLKYIFIYLFISVYIYR